MPRALHFEDACSPATARPSVSASSWVNPNRSATMAAHNVNTGARLIVMASITISHRSTIILVVIHDSLLDCRISRPHPLVEPLDRRPPDGSAFRPPENAEAFAATVCGTRQARSSQDKTGGFTDITP